MIANSFLNNSFFPVSSIIGKDIISGKIANINNNKNYNNVRVSLYLMKNGRLIRSFFSDENGAYIIKNINIYNGPFFIVAHDPFGDFNGVITDNIGGENVDD